ncbi:PAS/PAC sensor-containing diguanylate cyclase/phosphodiesterase [Planococcus donghaensis MPA1U2]|uniref:PAS/PAC sensor-containing diguanylate cyclase/phosphodiesterase n=1 Tax=Planococcus donghaensis MPA1U2 TaxID=933115 RepID=E7RJ58_9BACL|nr:sensor domain-containing diguanylate cyclase [Planococcus donghaensis]EGA88953.1 PAS/PAC sensor-containing diguanylate cyclase/phosphodiesterase [Planococcus donghaensis MPA1U2]
MLMPFTVEQLDLLYKNAKDPVYFMRQNGDTFDYMYVNSVCLTLFDKQLVGTNLDESMPPSLATEIKKQYLIALKVGKKHTYRDYSLFSDLETAMETELTPMEYGNERFVLAVTKNVTAQKKIEEDYLFFESLVQNSVDPMIMISADFMILDLNPAYENTFGVFKGQWIGRYYHELPDKQKELFGAGKNLLQQFSAQSKSTSMIMKRMKQDGTEAKFSVSYSPVKENGMIRAFHIVFRELTNELLLKNELKKTENILESYKEALNYAALVAIWNVSGTIEFVNDNLNELTGYKPSDMIGLNISEIGEAVVTPKLYKEIREVTLQGSIWRGQIKSVKRNGEFFWVDVTIIPLLDVDGEIYQFLSILFDVTERKQLEEKLHFMAYHDSLTNLPNRRFMIQQFQQIKEQADAKNEFIVLLYLDGDDFKLVNDQFGHDVGDEFIFHFGDAIKRSIRKEDLVARVGGDEFLVALRGVVPENSEQHIESVITRINESLDEGWTINDHHFTPTSSVGIAIYPEHGQDFDELVKKADAALYLAKGKGKGTAYLYSVL